MGEHLSQDGSKLRIYEQHEVHGEIYNELEDQVTLAKSTDDRIFKTINEIFGSEDAHRLLELGKGIGDNYATLKDKAHTKFIALKKAEDEAITELDIKEKNKITLT